MFTMTFIYVFAVILAAGFLAIKSDSFVFGLSVAAVGFGLIFGL